MENHKAIFMGRIERKIYGLNTNKYTTRDEYYGKPKIYETENFVNYDVIIECEFEKPPLEGGELIYLHEPKIHSVVNRRSRSTDGKYVYYLTHVIRVVEDEETLKSKQKAEELLKDEIVHYDLYIGKTNKKWYQFWI
jgi:hypothetical protein